MGLIMVSPVAPRQAQGHNQVRRGRARIAITRRTVLRAEQKGTGTSVSLAMSANDAKSSAMATHHVIDAETCHSNVSTRPMEVARTSRTQSKHLSVGFVIRADHVYSEYRAMNAHIHSLQEQVNHLYASLEALRNGQPFPIPNQGYDLHNIHPALTQPDPYRNNIPPSHPPENHPRFQGPTSTAFSFDVARSSLQTMGITASEANEGSLNEEEVHSNSSPHQARAPLAPMTIHSSKDPLWKISKDEAVRLCRVYEEEMGLMYPLLNMEKILGQVDSLYKFTEAAARTGLMNPFKPGPDAIGNPDIWILKMVLASSLIVEGDGQSVMARELYESCREAFEARLVGSVDIKGLILVTLVVSEPNRGTFEKG